MFLAPDLFQVLGKRGHCLTGEELDGVERLLMGQTAGDVGDVDHV